MSLRRQVSATGAVAAALAVGGGALAAAAPVVEPTRAASQEISAQMEVAEPRLDAELHQALRNKGWGPMLDRGDLAVALVDLSRSRLRYAGINDDQMIYAASLPKIAILLGAFDALERGDLAWTPGLHTQLVDMIRFSSNPAASAVLDVVGFEQVAAAVQLPEHGLYDLEDGGLWVGKAYGRDDYWQRDPIANTSHGATARQAARFFVMLHRGELVSPEASAQMKEILSDPGIEHKFVRGLRNRKGMQIYRKSGTWREYHADAALIEDGDRTYVAVGLARDKNGSRILERLIVTLDELIVAP